MAKPAPYCSYCGTEMKRPGRCQTCNNLNAGSLEDEYDYEPLPLTDDQQAAQDYLEGLFLFWDWERSQREAYHRSINQTNRRALHRQRSDLRILKGPVFSARRAANYEWADSMEGEDAD